MAVGEEKMTKIEAEKEVRKLHKKGPSWFCPLIREKCRTDCINYCKAFVYNENGKQSGNLIDIKRDDFQIQTPFCSNAMFIETALECPNYHE